MSDFRVAYSKLIRAVWANPGLEAAITADPGKLRDYGFLNIPTSVAFAAAGSAPSIGGYDDQMANASGSTVTFYIPPIPGIGAAPGSTGQATLGGDACCCCCPCCTCT